nr:MAG TPA: Tumor necrosis factor receptor superfamily domain, Tumor necrosis factor [Caudoviricetes sp.]DAK88548.1 MAG TPA: Tumor necrosis factor receptor superfamily domain, Tumor necrosis factor [Caudoviricetes sp.]
MLHISNKMGTKNENEAPQRLNVVSRNYSEFCGGCAKATLLIKYLFHTLIL